MAINRSLDPWRFTGLTPRASISVQLRLRDLYQVLGGLYVCAVTRLVFCTKRRDRETAQRWNRQAPLRENMGAFAQGHESDGHQSATTHRTFAHAI